MQEAKVEGDAEVLEVPPEATDTPAEAQAAETQGTDSQTSDTQASGAGETQVVQPQDGVSVP